MPIRHRTFPWVYVPVEKDPEGDDEIDDHSVVTEYGVPEELLFRQVQQDIKDEAAFLTIPFAIVFTMVFAICTANHAHNLIIGHVEESISEELQENAVFAYTDPGWMGHKTLSDVMSTPDVYSWLRVGLSPLLFSKFRVWSELNAETVKWPESLVPDHEKPLLQNLGYNRLVGGLELTQLRAEPRVCPNQEVSELLRMSCIPAEGVTSLNLHIEPEPFEIIGANVPIDPKLTVFFLVGDDPSSVGLRLQQMELSKWIDNSTIMVAANFMSYNAHFDSLTLSSSMFFFSRSGKIWKQLLHSTFVLNQYGELSVILWDAIFLAMCLSIFITECKEVVSEYHRYKKGASAREVIGEFVGDIWNVVDCISIAVSSALIVLWMLHCKEMELLTKELRDVSAVEFEVSTIFDEMSFEKVVRHLYTTFRETRNSHHRLEILACLFPLVLMVRLFKSFSGQPKLDLFTRSMVRASNDLFHFGVVFLATFLIFTMIGHSLFAHVLSEFRTFSRSFTSCFEVLMGQFDLGEMKGAGRAITTFWFLSFQIAMVLIMVNMFIAIIIDVYTNIKGDTHQDLQDIRSQVSELWRRWHQTRVGESISLAQIREGFLSNRACSKLQRSSTIPSEPLSLRKINLEAAPHIDKYSVICMVSDLMQVVPGLRKEQAMRLMLKTVRNFRAKHETPIGLVDAMRALIKIQNYLDVDDPASDGNDPNTNASVARVEEEQAIRLMVKTALRFRAVHDPASLPRNDSSSSTSSARVEGQKFGSLPHEFTNAEQRDVLQRTPVQDIAKRLQVLEEKQFDTHQLVENMGKHLELLISMTSENAPWIPPPSAPQPLTPYKSDEPCKATPHSMQN